MSSQTSEKNSPCIGITMGDAAGIGPELCLRVLGMPELHARCRLVLFGSAHVLERVSRGCRIPFDTKIIDMDQYLQDGLPDGGGAVVVDGVPSALEMINPGVVQSACGWAAFQYVQSAVGAAMRSEIDAVVTAPLHKEALRLAGVPYPGHTEMLASLTATPRYCMMMTSSDLSVCLATTHISLTHVSQTLTESRILDVIQLADQAMRRLGHMNPRVTVCGLNPHAGENGLFGDEEQRVIRPAVETARDAGIVVSDPIPPDTAFIAGVRENTDVYIAMYHDQGLIPFKMLAFETGVNVTLGLPIVRTSVDHGTAFDIAWQGKASAESLVAAVRTAIQFAAEK